MTTYDDAVGTHLDVGGRPARLPREGDAALLDALAAMPLFAGASARQLRAVAALVHLERRPAESLLLREGVPSGAVLVVVDGWATATQAGTALGVAGPGELVGDPAQLHRRTSALTWTCDTDVQVLAATPQAWREVCALLPRTYVRLTSTAEECAALEHADLDDWAWPSGLVGTAVVIALFAGVVLLLAGASGTFR